MRQICPNCQQSVTIAEGDAGKTVPCPVCQQPFAIPALFAATVFTPPPFQTPPANAGGSPATPPADAGGSPARAQTLPADAGGSPATPPADAGGSPANATGETQAPTSAASAPPEVKAAATPLAGYARVCAITLSRPVCQWLAPVCLTAILVLTFFNWVGMYPAGYASYTQNGWQALIADLSVDPVSEKEMKMEGPLNEWLRPSLWLLPYMILLLPGVLLAWSEPLARYGKVKLPPIVQGMLRLRPALLAACAGITLFFLLIQCTAGFGVERATGNMIQNRFRDDREKAKTPEEIQKVEMRAAELQGGFHLRTTIWLKLLIALHAIALLAIIGETLLIHRGDKPPPRIGVMW